MLEGFLFQLQALYWQSEGIIGLFLLKIKRAELGPYYMVLKIIQLRDENFCSSACAMMCKLLCGK